MSRMKSIIYKSYTQFLYKRSPRQGHLYLNACEKFCQDVIVEQMIQSIIYTG